MNLLQPFITLWVGKENTLSDIFVLLLVVYFFIYEFTLLIGCYKDISGKWHADRFRPLLTAIFNLILNIIMVKYIGLYGVLLSTIISFIIINIPWLYRRVFIDVFNENDKYDYAIYLLKSFAVLLICILFSTIVCHSVNFNNSVLEIIVRLLIIIFINIFVQLVFNRNNKEFERAISLIKKVVS